MFKLSLRLSLSLILSLFISLANAQNPRDASVELTAVVQPDSARITLQWRWSAGSTSYTVQRKIKGAGSWGPVLAMLPADAVSYTDSTVTKGIAYEYRLVRSGLNFTGYGYILTGIEVPAIDFRGRLILVIEDTLKEPLALEINRLIADIEGDGWQVVTHYVPRDTAVTAVKSLIVDTYNEDPANTKAIFLLGRIPVPYSGDLFPDGHPDHEGAWPADVYYADVNGNWTDAFVDVSVATDPRHRNIPADGKFDQSVLPSNAELQIGRVDLYNMPAFALPEVELLRQYLDKDHAYRHKLFEVNHRAVIDDNFGYFSGEAFAASGWKNFATLVGTDNVIASDYFTTMTDSSYLWSFGCGGGWYQGAGGIGSTSDFATANLQNVFTVLFGSYFGDWDSQNNFLRAPLAQGITLASFWSGRPHWQFHHMGLGENIGYSTRISQNNSVVYFSSYGEKFVHIALMGDPTLRNDILAPPSALQAEATERGIRLTWEHAPEPVIGYHVYMRTAASEPFTRLTEVPVTANMFEDPCIPEAGSYTYMVRAIALQYSPSGSYENLSQGITVQMDHPGAPEVIADATWDINGSDVSFVNFSMHADAYLWIFGDGSTSTDVSPTHTYLDGLFDGYMVAYTDCDSDTLFFQLDIFTGLYDLQDDPTLMVTPNPSNGKLVVTWDRDGSHSAGITIYHVSGRWIRSQQNYVNGQALDLTDLPAGTYFMRITAGDNMSIRKIVMER